MGVLGVLLSVPLVVATQVTAQLASGVEAVELAKRCYQQVETRANTVANMREGVATCERAAKAKGASPKDAGASWVNVARARLRLGDASRGDAAIEQYELGREAARAALALNPKDDDALFWDMAHLACIGRSKGVVSSLFMLSELKAGLERVLELNPDHHYARDTLAKIYHKVPGALGGSDEKAEALLLEVLRREPKFTSTMVTLGQLYIDLGREAEARVWLQKVLDTKSSESARPNDHWRFNVPDAKRELARLEGK